MTMKKVLVLSGPPGCGKDTAGNAIAQHMPVSLEKFSAPLKAAVPAFLGVGFDELERQKEEPVGFCSFPSFRQMQIDLSERWAKPLYGQDIFARLLVARVLRSPHDHVVITDCGFRAELDVLIAEFGLANVLFVKVYREGCYYENDSRSGFKLPVGLRFIPVYNDYSEAIYVNHILQVARNFFL